MLSGCNLLWMNRRDKAGKRHGRWTVRWENGKRQSTGKYWHGEEVGKWKYFTADGLKYKQEEYDGEGEIFTRFYESGKLAQEGRAYQYETKGAINYIWQGVWHQYKEGKYQNSLMYLNGNAIDTLILKQKDKP